MLRVLWERHGVLLRNIASMGAIQGVVYLVPLALLPFLVRVLGAERYGELVFAQSVALYFQILVEYGYGLSATRAISLVREDHRRTNAVVFAVLQKRALLLLGSACVYAAIVLSVQFMRSDAWLFFFCFLAVTGVGLTPTWLYQGMEEMAFVTITVLVTRLIPLAPIFIWAREPDDHVMVAMWFGIGAIASAVFALAHAFMRYRLAWRPQPWAAVREQFANGRHVAASSVVSTLIANSNVVVLGLIAGGPALGYYAAGEKLVRALCSLTVPINSALFPVSARMIESDRDSAFRFLRRVLFIGMALFGAVSLLVALAAEPLVVIALGDELLPATILVTILAPLPLIVFLTNLFGAQVGLNTGQGARHFRGTAIAGVLNVLLVVSLGMLAGGKGVAIANVLAECVGMLLMFAIARSVGFR